MLGRLRLVITCEHASAHVPKDLAPAFTAGAGLLGEPAAQALAGHRGCDLGACDVAMAHGAAAAIEPIVAPVSRLVVDTNRSRRHPKVFSAVTRALSDRARAELIAQYWQPHVGAVYARVDQAVGSGGLCLHLAWHSFTPIWQGLARPVDIGLLYDPQRPAEKAWVMQMQQQLAQSVAHLRVRRNVPYKGTADGLPTQLRRLHGPSRYAGIEIEVNQRLVTEPAWPKTVAALVAAAQRANVAFAKICDSF